MNLDDLHNCIKTKLSEAELNPLKLKSNSHWIVDAIDQCSLLMASGELDASRAREIFNLSNREISVLIISLEKSGFYNKLNAIADLMMRDDLYLEFDRICQWIKNAIESIKFAPASEFPKQYLKTYLEIREHEETGKISLGVRIGKGNSVRESELWDEFFISCQCPLALCIKTSMESDIPLSAKFIQKQTVQHGPLSNFHPERMASYRKYPSEPIGKSISKTALGTMTYNQMILLRSTTEKESAKAISETPVRESYYDWVGKKHLIARRECEVFAMRGAYNCDGRRIFDIDRSMVKMFMETDIAEIGFDVLKSPFRSFYLHFGGIEDLAFNDDWHVDGAYVCHDDSIKSFQVMLTFIPTNPELLKNWATTPEPYYSISARGEEYNGNMGGVIAAVIHRQKSENDENLIKIRDYGRVITPDGKIKETVDITRFVAKIEAPQLDSFFKIAERSLRIVINSICCISSYSDKIKKKWPKNSPKELLLEMESENPTVRNKAESALEKLGFRKISTLSEESFLTTQESSAIHGSKSTHWRKGHWRHQAIGIGWKDHKLTWIRPALINRESGTEPKGGIYDISPHD
jgi:hypothetical protein